MRRQHDASLTDTHGNLTERSTAGSATSLSERPAYYMLCAVYALWCILSGMDTLTFAALADPNRFRIVELLRESTHSVNEVAESLHMSQPQASRHLHALLRAGLVTMTPVAQQRIFALRPEPFHELTAWLNSFESRWNDRFTALDHYLKRQKEE